MFIIDDLFSEVPYVLIGVCLTYIIYRIAAWFVKGRVFDLRRDYRSILMILYIGCLFEITLTPLHPNLDVAEWHYRIQLIPFETISRYWPIEGYNSFRNIIGNIILLVPFAPLAHLYFDKKGKQVSALFLFGFALLLSLGIEITQLFLTETRAFDVDDILLNMIGFAISLLLWRFIWLFIQKKR